MEDYWLLILISILIAFLLKSLINLFSSGEPCLPPGPTGLPFIGNLLLLRRSFSRLEPILRSLHAKYGPAITLRVGSRVVIFIADRGIAHRALIQNDAVFANRPPASAVVRVTSSDQHNISSSYYGPTWRLLRRNLTAEILHPSRVRSYSHARAWVLEVLKNRIGKSGSEPVMLMEEFQYAMFCLLAYMCFGDKLEEKQILEIERVERTMLLNLRRFRQLNLLNFAPRITKILMRKRWSEFLQLRKEQEEVLLPLIRSRKEQVKASVTAYVDTLFDLELPDEKRKLTEPEIVTLCNEFLNAGTDTTATALQWIMANLVKYTNLQTNLFNEIKTLEIAEGAEIKEEHLQKLPYLKAVVLEGLRRHPPVHFVLPHTATTDEAELGGGYRVPKKASVNFFVAEIGRDPEAWDDPMSFRPERFMGETTSFDITCGKEIKMMPFGAGRRMCPAYGLALLHLEYFVANLIWSFEWKVAAGEEVDLSEGEEFTTLMKNPLKAHVLAGGYSMPVNGTMNFMVAQMGRDSKVWEYPMPFRPERFMEDTTPFDLTCAKEIKIMPFWCRKEDVCLIALFHSERFVANFGVSSGRSSTTRELICLKGQNHSSW
ncbi:Cytochrome P450 89A2 [Linum perenne]